MEGSPLPDERPNSEFALYYAQDAGRIVGVGGDRKEPYPAPYEPASILCIAEGALKIFEVDALQFWTTAPKDTVSILPVDSSGSRRVWRWSDRRKILEAAYHGEFVVRGSRGHNSVLLKDRVKSGENRNQFGPNQNMMHPLTEQIYCRTFLENVGSLVTLSQYTQHLIRSTV